MKDLVNSMTLFHLRMAAAEWLKEHSNSPNSQAVCHALLETDPDGPVVNTGQDRDGRSTTTTVRGGWGGGLFWGGKVIVRRMVTYDGDKEWVRYILSKSLPEGRRELGGKGNFIEVEELEEEVANVEIPIVEIPIPIGVPPKKEGKIIQ